MYLHISGKVCSQDIGIFPGGPRMVIGCVYSLYKAWLKVFLFIYGKKNRLKNILNIYMECIIKIVKKIKNYEIILFLF